MNFSNDYLKINQFTDIDYSKILEDYRSTFHGKAVIVETNYNLLKEFKVVFNQRDLPHLMGWEKVASNGKKSATDIINAIDDGSFTLQNTRNHHNFNSIKKRMLHYNFLHDIFIEQKVDICVMTSDMKPNPLRLDIVFYQDLKLEAVVFGLRRNKRMQVFIPTTLHTEKLNNPYHFRRRSKINKIVWE